MKRKIFIVLSFTFLAYLDSTSQDKAPYRIFSKDGRTRSYKKLVNVALENQVILFGEHHDNSLIHWLELEVAKDLSKHRKLLMGAEMIETDNQQQLNKYLQGEITQKQLDSTARLWTNYKTDYKPLVDFAKASGIPFVATNVPRRFASLVYKGGFEALEKLPAEDHAFMPPLPIPYDKSLPGYTKMVAEMGGHGGENLPKAQALKDATIAWSILKNITEDVLFLHYNGTYHSDNFDGIFWYLKRQQPKLKILTIATVSQADVNALEAANHNKADFIIVIDEDVTKTY